MTWEKMETFVLSSVRDGLAGLIARVEKGDEIAIAHDDGDKAIAVIVPFAAWKKKPQRKLGSLHHCGPVYFADDFRMSDDELLNS
jgi:antitoxin (DNA-binding transcriptional repressor) of toxin-antitoxin stability system